MELKEFLEKFLPDFKERKAKEVPHSNRKNYGVLCAIWERKNFPEALQTYTDLICQKQRENCAIWATDNALAVNGSFDDFYDSIKKIEQPKIEEL